MLEIQMDMETIDYIIRSRPIILEILENRGYDIENYKNVAPSELMEIALKSPQLLRITGVQTIDEKVQKVHVIYQLDPYRLKVKDQVPKLMTSEPPAFDVHTEEVIMILNEPIHDTYHTVVSDAWISYKFRISFIPIKNILSNPTKHIMVPPHRKLSEEEAKGIMSALHLRSKNELPHIKYHVDMQARILGLVPGDIVEIKRPSETSGITTLYRVCTV